MTTKDEIRPMVSDAYAEALRRSKGGVKRAAGGCCEPTASCEPAGSAAKDVGYEAKDPGQAEALKSSFGCGNPLAFAEVPEGATVLDLGSGAGIDLLIAAKKVGPTGKVIGVDMTDEMIEAARENARKGGYENVEVRKGIIEELPVEDASVDLVVSNCVVNLSPDKERVFAEIARVLKPGGRFSIYDIVVEELPQALRNHPAAYSACVSGAIPEGEYLDGLTSAGLSEVEVADRMVYSLEQLRGIVSSDLDQAGLDPAALDDLLAGAVGKVASVRVVGRR